MTADQVKLVGRQCVATGNDIVEVDAVSKNSQRDEPS